MKYRKQFLSRWLLVGIVVFSLSGCSGASSPSGSASLGSAPSDEEVLKAIHNSGLFSGGAEKFILKSPIEVMERGSRNKDGSWTVKVRIVYASTAHGRESGPVEKTPVFRIYESKNSSGKTAWKAVVGS